MLSHGGCPVYIIIFSSNNGLADKYLEPRKSTAFFAKFRIFRCGKQEREHFDHFERVKIADRLHFGGGFIIWIWAVVFSSSSS